ncbi:GntR family transcriptional regulator [Leifsonia shinshuensis]|uniref:GntR family transcriptional regulator n=1 Tax=Leifsonia shinshuensis TaxID=150026 RepID=A0A853CXJ6_9MICO|nr:GntR family transcriptional regulator [Leifsonia shinshuensis]
MALHAEAEEFLSRPLERRMAIPLRVEVYTRLTEAIRAGVFPESSLMPSESEIGAALGVSRTVVREAMLLLAEDGFVNSVRGVGRVVSGRLPETGLEKLRPFEEASGDAGRLRRTQHRAEPASADFVASGLGLAPNEPTWLFESVILNGSTPSALLQEHLPGGAVLRRLSPELAEAIEQDTGAGSSALRTLLDALGARLGPAQSRLSVGAVGASRGAVLGLDATAPVLIITQTLECSGRPIYLAKILVDTAAMTPTIVQAL